MMLFLHLLMINFKATVRPPSLSFALKTIESAPPPRCCSRIYFKLIKFLSSSSAPDLIRRLKWLSFSVSPFFFCLTLFLVLPRSNLSRFLLSSASYYLSTYRLFSTASGSISSYSTFTMWF